MASPAAFLALVLLLGIPREDQSTAPPSTTYAVSVPPIAPSNAVPLSQTLLSFSIEQDRWPEWIVDADSPNTFFLNALGNIAQLAGVPPRIRIGADSSDRTNFNAAVQLSDVVFPESTETVPYPEAANVVTGPDFYTLASLLPQGTQVIWGVNFGGSNMTALDLGAAAIGNAFKSQPMESSGVTLQAIEVGNEPDLYARHGVRAKDYGISQYVKEWTSFAVSALTIVSEVVGVTVPLQALSFAESSRRGKDFSPQSAFSAGLLNSTAGKNIRWVSQHHYSGSFCAGSHALLQDLMAKAYIRSNLTAFQPDIAAVKSRGLLYVLGETNSFACHGAPGVSDVAGAALWALDYTLFAAQLGIERLFFHQGIGYKYNFIQPVALNISIENGHPLDATIPPHIQPAYYAAIIVAEAIGPTGATTALELEIDADMISGYVFYEAGRLARIVLINLRAYSSDAFGPRGSVTVQPNLGQLQAADGASVTVKRLSIPSADATTGLTWGGQTYETEDATISGDADVEMLEIDQGISVVLADTEAVMLSFDWS